MQCFANTIEPLLLTMSRILHYIHYLRSFRYTYYIHNQAASRFDTGSVSHARLVLAHYILHRLCPDADDSWTGAAIVTYVWMSIGGPVPQTYRESLISELDLILATWKKPLEVDAARAAMLVRFPDKGLPLPGN